MKHKTHMTMIKNNISLFYYELIKKPSKDKKIEYFNYYSNSRDVMYATDVQYHQGHYYLKYKWVFSNWKKLFHFLKVDQNFSVAEIRNLIFYSEEAVIFKNLTHGRLGYLILKEELDSQSDIFYLKDSKQQRIAERKQKFNQWKKTQYTKHQHSTKYIK